MDPVRRRAVGHALRAHRGRSMPADFGLPATARRRTPGLRREEVAALSGVGTTWYAGLEQGRVDASPAVLGALSRALRLDDAAARHLMGLAGHAGSCAGGPTGGAVDLLRPLLDGWPTSPALALDRRFDVIAWNAAWAALWGDPGAVDAERRTLLWLLTAERPVRERTEGWEALVGALAAQFRGRADRHPDDPRFGAIYELLRAVSPQLDPLWARPGVCDFTAQTVVVDGIRLAVYMVRPIDDPDTVVLVQAPVDNADRAAMAKLIDAAA